MNYYVLDTDHLTILERRSQPACNNLVARMANYSPDFIFTTIINFQEQFQGWMAFINKATSASGLLMAYHKLEKLIQSSKALQILPYDQNAYEVTEKLKQQRVRISTLDLRIAWIFFYGVLIVNDSTTPSRNSPLKHGANTPPSTPNCCLRCGCNRDVPPPCADTNRKA